MLRTIERALLGDLPDFSRDPLGFVEARLIGRDTPLPVRFGPRRALLIGRPSAARHVLVDARDRYGKGEEQERLRPLFGDGMVTASGKRWQDARVAARPSFSTEGLQDGLRQAFGALAGEVGRLAPQIGRELDLHPVLGRLALRMVVSALFRGQLGDDEAEAVYQASATAHHRLTDAMMRMVDLDALLPTAANRRFRGALDILEGLVDRLSADPRGVLAALKPLEGEHGSKVLRDEAVTMLIAGFETTAMAACWLVYTLACRPDLVAWIRPEVDAALDGGWGVDPARLRDMPRTKALVQEVLRLYPSAWWYARVALADDVVDGMPVAKGTSMLICPWALHRQPDLWPEPWKMNPERFLGDAGRDKFAFLPFGAGARACIGGHLATSELMGIAAMLVAAFDLEPLSGPLEAIRPVGGVTLSAPDGGFRVRLELRQQRRRAA